MINVKDVSDIRKIVKETKPIDVVRTSISIALIGKTALMVLISLYLLYLTEVFFRNIILALSIGLVTLLLMFAFIGLSAIYGFLIFLSYARGELNYGWILAITIVSIVLNSIVFSNIEAVTQFGYFLLINYIIDFVLIGVLITRYILKYKK